jgi:hypothetical protein
MEKTVAGVVTAAAAALALSQAQAAPTGRPATEVLAASSYADLLRPIPDALKVLRANPRLGVPVRAVSYNADGQPAEHHHNDQHHQQAHHHHHGQDEPPPPHHHHHHHHSQQM